MPTKPELNTLPAELRSEIWSLALLPSPGVYRCDPYRFIYTGAGYRHALETDVEDARWLIQKRRYPTVMHLCRESRFVALSAMEREVREKSFFYYIGQDTRIFIPEIDILWFDDEDHGGSVLQHPAVILNRGVIGGRVHAIRNLAVSVAIVSSRRQGGFSSSWDSYITQCFERFESLQRVDVVFGPVPMETRCDGYKTDKDYWAAAVPETFRHQVILTGEYDVPELKLLREIQGSSFEIIRPLTDQNQNQDPKVIKEKLDKVRADIYGGSEMSAQKQKDATTAAPGQGQQQPVAEVVHQGKDLSKITFHATLMVETARFRGRTIRKSFPSWYFSKNDDSDDFESL
ncbi:hypothetical protein PgNI_05890 [Pyricularia grisea]|uniref:2EXR domain-containing protein n=1 Tax=Pyricularia grisea TaxID=148305 RepID=A0A6P8B6P1_PYRGI|nr:hypothetical protein PgNI_05890 [Pyricularia grisea]TLD10933.1 hypothetical protein PgNI_05890 [Pyricularia grisea]